ncbi:beta strand repeat-containing protein [Argonema antarcticum]|uniref:beta strand repeat-containing protein n=1 Tax=Argonema antarcticum TaxID=2942763 RepID=UPI0020118FE6|nr:S-layer family protein [Argonema antarcticum]MCL1471524.1 S-layer family protein [Argonema antarcticum A004/B2]
MQTYGWIRCCWRLLWVSYLTLSGTTLFTQYVLAQLIPDPTLGSESSVITPTIINDRSSDRIDGGAIRGANLFHSFREFNVESGGGVYFSNPGAIERIITRVTGGNSSQILGTLGVLGNADLFLINPNGIIFGPKARLDLKGSFIGSTASSIIFANGIEFSATNPQAPALLAINVPLGLQYGANPDRIINRSADGTPDPTLQVPIGKTFALVGGDVMLEGGTMKASQGRIELGSVGDNSLVNLTPMDRGWALNYDGVQNFRDISLSQGAIVDTSGPGGGDIQVQARRLSMTDGALIYYANEGSERGGNIDITTSESVELVGGLNPAFGDLLIYTEITNFTLGTGATGNVTIKTGRLTIRDGAIIANQSSGAGNAGNLTVVASELIELIGVVPDNPFMPSGLFAQAFSDDVLSTGKGGNLSIETKRLIIRDGALIGTNTFTAGQAGNLTVKASESIELIGTNPSPGLSGGIGAGVNTGAKGNSGDLTIETKRLTIQGGGQIAASTLGEGNGGDLIVNASESIELIGAAINADLRIGSSGLFASAERGATGKVGDARISAGRLIVRDGARISADNFGTNSGGNLILNVGQLIIQNGGTVRAGSFGDGPGGILDVNADSVQVTGIGTLGGKTINSALFTEADASGMAGNLTITTGSLRIADSGEVNVGSLGSGAAGSLEINAGSIDLDNFGKLRADSKAGFGNINIQTRNSLILRGNSGISTNSQGIDPGGNISITAANLVALENSDITANATNSFGGQVTINASGIFGTQFRDKQSDVTSDITATSDLGAQFGGTVQINTPDVDPSAGLVELSTTVVDVEGLVAKNVCTRREEGGSSFVVTGRGGLPPNPNDPLTNEIVAVSWARPDRANSKLRGGGRGRSEPQINNYQIVEAQGWIVAADGTIILTAKAPTATPHSPGLIHPGC